MNMTQSSAADGDVSHIPLSILRSASAAAWSDKSHLNVILCRKEKFTKIEKQKVIFEFLFFVNNLIFFPLLFKMGLVGAQTCKFSC